MKRKLTLFVLLAAGAILPLGINCPPEPDITLDLLRNLPGLGGA
jgi:hypothetical protein